MNKNIEALALEAGMVKTSLHYGRRDPYVLWEDDIEKFADLIVEKCLDACSRANEIRHFVPPTQQQVVLSCMDEIERIFRR
jgi:hypothetical protein